ncbi:hypothetical protein HA466_0104270 [Hirschfeldia incana]|nr:hypothetical protein HA466_0104270 [Hirschfeldia incana]
MSKEILNRAVQASAPLLFRQVSPGPGESTFTFRLLHFWESRKNVKGGPQILLGLELLMIDEEGTLAQGFIGQNRRFQYETELERGRIYTLTNFYASNSKVIYHVADQKLVICISHASVLTKVEGNNEGILMVRFRLHSFSEFEANCDLRDVVGHLKLVDGQPLHQRPVLCAKDDSTARNVLVHLQLKDGPVMNVYLWDEAAENFRIKFDASAATPTVLLVTTVTPKRFGGKLCLSSMYSSRVFLDDEVAPTKEYFSWLTTNPSPTTSVNSIEVVKAETLTIREIAAFIKSHPPKVAYFDCIATIDDVRHGVPWYYIACKDCQRKLNRGPAKNLTLLYLHSAKKHAFNLASTSYRVEMSAYDNEEQCTLIILGDAGKELTGRKATELIDSYVEANGDDVAEVEVPLPQCLIDTIGQTKKFRIKVSPFNFTSGRLSFTATRIVSPAVLPPKNPLLTLPPIPLSKPDKNITATEVDVPAVTGSSGGGHPFPTNAPATAIEGQKQAKRIKPSG